MAGRADDHIDALKSAFKENLPAIDGLDSLDLAMADFGGSGPGPTSPKFELQY